jgi:hypothetical protein
VILLELRRQRLVTRSNEVIDFLLQRMSPLLAQSGHPDTLNQCPLSGAKRTSRS